MLMFPEYNDEPLKDSLQEMFDIVDLEKTVPKYIREANKRLRYEANQYRREDGLELLPKIELIEKNV